jgi:hypothetical protein
MKKLLLITLAIYISACSSDQQEQDDNLNCNCDRVVEVNTFNIIGTPQNPTTTYHCVYITINDCTQIQRQKTYDTTVQSEIPRINQCR